MSPRDPNKAQRFVPGWNIALSEERLNYLCTVMRLPAKMVSDMLLSSYDGAALDLSLVRTTEQATWEHIWYGHWVHFVGSNFCPHCLVETGGAWKLAWKLAWSFACTAHHCLLVDVCPSCGRQASLESREGHSFLSPSRSMEPTVCRRSVNVSDVCPKRDRGNRVGSRSKPPMLNHWLLGPCFSRLRGIWMTRYPEHPNVS